MGQFDKMTPATLKTRKCKISQGPGMHMSGNLQPLSSSPPGQNISLGLHIVGQLAGHTAPEGDLTERKNYPLKRKQLSKVFLGFLNYYEENLRLCIRLGWKGLPVTNTIAYYKNPL
jgi:hypothetical protein